MLCYVRVILSWYCSTVVLAVVPVILINGYCATKSPRPPPSIVNAPNGPFIKGASDIFAPTKFWRGARKGPLIRGASTVFGDDEVLKRRLLSTAGGKSFARKKDFLHAIACFYRKLVCVILLILEGKINMYKKIIFEGKICTRQLAIPLQS